MNTSNLQQRSFGLTITIISLSCRTAGAMPSEPFCNQQVMHPTYRKHHNHQQHCEINIRLNQISPKVLTDQL